MLNNLPLQLTSFIGREREIAEIAGLLRTSRLVSLTGAGGVGKTRLALKVPSGQLDSYVDGVWLIELAALADPLLGHKILNEERAARAHPLPPSGGARRINRPPRARVGRPGHSLIRRAAA